jgi:DNA-binding response OmpR family regulator
VAGSVAAARELLARQSPDRIIMELHFPDADGFAFANELALRFPGMPIIAMTAANGRDLELRASAVGCALYVRKPIDVGVFAAQVHATPLPLPEPLED